MEAPPHGNSPHFGTPRVAVVHPPLALPPCQAIKATVGGILLFPDLFKEYLLENVGFASCEEVFAPKDVAGLAKGFERPLLVCVK